MYQLNVKLTKKVFGGVGAVMLLKKFFVFYVIIAVADIILIINPFVAYNGSYKWSDYLFPIVFTLLFFCIPLVQAVLELGWGKNPIAGQPAKFVLSDDGLKIDGSTYHFSHEWSNFMGVKLFGMAIVLFLTKNQVIIIPNDSFSNSTERLKIFDFIRGKIPKIPRR
jgi:hypothetical protein